MVIGVGWVGLGFVLQWVGWSLGWLVGRLVGWNEWVGAEHHLWLLGWVGLGFVLRRFGWLAGMDGWGID